MKASKAKRSWYLLMSKSQSELKAQQNLQRQGYETYLPLVQLFRRRKGKYINRTEPFFPRYLFIALDQETDNWAPIRSTIGVSDLVRFGGLPAFVPDDMIMSLKLNEDEMGFQKIASKPLTRGDLIEIVEGPFEGYKAVYQEMKGTDRVSVLLDIVGKNTQITLSRDNLLLV